MIMKGLHATADGIGYLGEMVPVDIADGHDPCAGIRDMTPAHTAYADDALGQLVAGCKITSA